MIIQFDEQALKFVNIEHPAVDKLPWVEQNTMWWGDTFYRFEEGSQDTYLVCAGTRYV